MDSNSLRALHLHRNGVQLGDDFLAVTSIKPLRRTRACNCASRCTVATGASWILEMVPNAAEFSTADIGGQSALFPPDDIVLDEQDALIFSSTLASARYSPSASCATSLFERSVKRRSGLRAQIFAHAQYDAVGHGRRVLSSSTMKSGTTACCSEFGDMAGDGGARLGRSSAAK